MTEKIDPWEIWLKIVEAAKLLKEAEELRYRCFSILCDHINEIDPFDAVILTLCLMELKRLTCALDNFKQYKIHAQNIIAHSRAIPEFK